jgi:hypothetical protein
MYLYLLSIILVNNYLKEIANEYNIDWEPTDLGIEADSLGPVSSPSGFSIPIAPCSSLDNAYRPPEKVHIYIVILLNNYICMHIIFYI